MHTPLPVPGSTVWKIHGRISEAYRSHAASCGKKSTPSRVWESAGRDGTVNKGTEGALQFSANEGQVPGGSISGRRFFALSRLAGISSGHGHVAYPQSVLQR